MEMGEGEEADPRPSKEEEGEEAWMKRSGERCSDDSLIWEVNSARIEAKDRER
jgi:hypothetical protein